MFHEQGANCEALGAEVNHDTDSLLLLYLLYSLYLLYLLYSQGANCEVLGAEVDHDTDSPAMGWVRQPNVPSRLAVKMYKMGHTSDRGAGAVMREVMWEVHVLRRIQHVSFHGSDTPAHGSDTPAHGSDTPAHGSDTPAHGSDASAHGSDTPAALHGRSISCVYAMSLSLLMRSTL